MRSFKEHLDESSLSRIWKHAKDHSVGTITAYRAAKECGNGEAYTKAQNKSRNVVLSAKLLKLGYSITRVKGTYIENFGSSNEKPVSEESFLVVDVKDKGTLMRDLIKLGEQFEQDSITFSEKGDGNYFLISTNRCEDAYPGFGEVGKKKKLGKSMFGKSGEFHSKVNGRPFVFEDFVTGRLMNYDDKTVSIRSKHAITVLSETDVENAACAIED